MLEGLGKKINYFLRGYRKDTNGIDGNSLHWVTFLMSGKKQSGSFGLIFINEPVI